MKVVLLTLLLAVAAQGTPTPIQEPVTMKKVARFLRKNPEVRTIGDFLGYLPKTFRSQFTLMHESHSSQDASPKNPRAIVYGQDASFVLAFNGSTEQEGYHLLETYQWHPRKRRFEFRVFDFSPGLERVVPSGKNPKQCLGCHGSDPRPNWEPYPTWPGAYAGNDDELEKDGMDLNKDLSDFFKKAKGDDRYSKLEGLEESYKPGIGPRTKVQHNIRFSTLVSQMNFQRMARLMEATPDFSFHRYEAMGNLAHCGSRSHDTHSEQFLKLFEDRGIDVSRWTTSRIKGSYNLGSPNSWASELLARVLENQPDLTHLFWSYTGYYGFPQAQALQSEERLTCDGLEKAAAAHSM